MTSYWAEFGWLDGTAVAGVRLVTEDGRWAAIEPGVARSAADTELAGLALPGLANTHSHAFHRALRGRTHDGGGTFWTWRERMYAVAARLDPDSYHALARATFAEMALAGISCVGEFHYLHHTPDGSSYADPNAMGSAVLDAAREAGIRITLLDTCYLSSGVTASGARPLEAQQRRFGDGDAERWAARVAHLQAQPHARIGAAI